MCARFYIYSWRLTDLNVLARVFHMLLFITEINLDDDDDNLVNFCCFKVVAYITLDTLYAVFLYNIIIGVDNVIRSSQYSQQVLFAS